MIEYQGYVARVEFDAEASVFHGRVTNSGPYPVATFESTRAGSLRKEFEQSIDTYLAVCEELGVEPRRPTSGTLNVRLGSELHARVAMAAEEAGLSINAWIVRTLDAGSRT